MRTFRYLLAALLVALLTPVLAQDVIAGDDFNLENVTPYGDFQTAYEAYDVADAGAIVLTYSSPDDQQPNFDVVGPMDYWEHFDFSRDDEFVLDDLVPGFYSVSATDEGLELAHTVVQVRAGEAVAVNVNMGVWEEGFTAGSYDPYGTYGSYDGYEDAYPGYPYGAYNVGPYEAYGGSADFGAIAIGSVTEGTDVVITGPNGFSQAFESDAIVENLPPGVYVVAASGADTDLAVTTVEVQAAQQRSVTPSFTQMSGMSGDSGDAGMDATTAAGAGLLGSYFATDGSEVTTEDFRMGVFDMWDVNDDDLLLEDEYNEAVNWLYDGSAPFAYGDLDANGDGEITVEEFDQNYGDDLYNTFDANGDDTLTVEELGNGFYDLLDADDDGAIIADELDRASNWFDVDFDALDADGSGDLNQQEFAGGF